MKNLRITIRIENKDREKIERLIKNKKFKTISQIIRTAIQDFLAKQ